MGAFDAQSGEVVNPIAEVDVSRPGIAFSAGIDPEGQVERQVPVTEDERCEPILLLLVPAVLPKPFGRRPIVLSISNSVGSSAVRGQALGNAHAHIRMERLECALKDGVRENSLEPFVPLVSRAEPIAMPNQVIETIVGKPLRAAVNVDTQF